MATRFRVIEFRFYGRVSFLNCGVSLLSLKQMRGAAHRLPLVLGELQRGVAALLKRPQPQWRACDATAAEMALAEKAAVGDGAVFDTLGLKRGVWEAWKGGGAGRGAVRLVCKESPGLARVLCFLPTGVAEPDWGTWGRVFQWFGPAASGAPWLVVWFAAERDRAFPAAGVELAAEHVNGGYTMPCSTEGIFIYREEEATRVLIHEMMHAACLDEQGPEWTIPLREAQVEVWAELILVALRARGSAAVRRLWGRQAQWVADVNWRAQQMHGTHDISDYAWRYLCGREVMYRRLGVALPAARPAIAAKIESVRFTCPQLGD